MSAMLEKYLYDIDQSFAQKSEKDVKMIYAMVFIVLVMFSYLVFWESSEKGYNDIKAASLKVQEKIAKDKQYLLMHPTWGSFIDSVAENAKKHKVKLNFFANRLATDKTTFGHVLNLEIQAVAPYKNMIKFVNAIEKSKLVVDLHDLDLVATEKLNLDLNLSVWGITY
jgi:Tfp pilus assembly protein PilO